MPALRIKDEALKMSLYFYALGAYPVLDKLSTREIRKVSEAVLEFTGETEPFRTHENGEFPKRDIPYFGEVSVFRAIAINGAILIKRQWEIEGPEELSDKSAILEVCAEAYKVHRPVAQGRLCL